MSHSPQRKEKDCLNCGTIVHGRYCHACGQENIVPKENFWSLLIHFFYDITHFDSKFFDTLRYLLFRPGFLSKEYIQGKRISYLNPIRMYLFTSAIFFLIFFSFRSPTLNFNKSNEMVLTTAQRNEMIKEMEEELKIRPTNKAKKTLAVLYDSARQVTMADIYDAQGARIFSISGEEKYKSVAEYDSAQKKLPAKKRDSWIKRKWMQKEISINSRFRNNTSAASKEFSNTFLHTLPYMLFVSLPFSALILKLLYVRRKKFYYADHGIFSIHYYIFDFILLLILFGVNALGNVTGWGIFNYIQLLLLLIWPVYLYIAMKKFYGQGWLKTFFKFFLYNLLGLFLVITLFIIFVFFSIFQL